MEAVHALQVVEQRLNWNARAREAKGTAHDLGVAADEGYIHSGLLRAQLTPLPSGVVSGV